MGLGGNWNGENVGVEKTEENIKEIWKELRIEKSLSLSMQKDIFIFIKLQFQSIHSVPG